METKDRRRHARPSPTKRPAKRPPEKKERKLKDSDVIYTPPKPFHRGRFILHLLTITAVVIAIVFGMSIFFKVEKVLVSGCNKYSAWEVSEASGVEIGSNLMTVSRAQISGNVISKLPYVGKVRVGINLPDTVNIEITELDVVYTIEDNAGDWWFMNDQGRIVEKTDKITAEGYTQVLGVKIEVPQIGQQAVAKEEQTQTIPATETSTDTEGDTTVLDVTVPTIMMGTAAAEKLSTALTILQELSVNSVSGDVDSVDVTSQTSLELWYDERFQVNLGDLSQLNYKINALKATVKQMESYESGHLDLSFTNWPDKVGYTPFT